MPLEISHSSPDTRGTYCDGKPCFEVLLRRHKRTESETYWCGQLHGYFNPFDCECPKDGKRIELPKPEFNRGWKRL